MAYYDEDNNKQSQAGYNNVAQNVQPQPESVSQQQDTYNNQAQQQQNAYNTQTQQGAQYQGQYSQQYSQTNNYVDTGHSPTQVLVFGILSVSISVVFGWTVLLGILSIVFGALAIGWAKKFNQLNPGVELGQVKAGRITGIIGLVFGIIEVVSGLIIFPTFLMAMLFGTMFGAY